MIRQSHEPALLTGEEIAFIRRTLIACSQVLAWASQHGDPQLREVMAEATMAAEGNRGPGGLAGYANLAIDYLDFAPAGRSKR